MAQLHPFLPLAFGRGEWSAKCPSHSLGLTTGPQPLQKQFLHRVQSSASSFNFHYPLISLRSSSSCLRLLPPLPITSNLHSIFLSIMYFVRQFLCKMWPTQYQVSLLTCICLMAGVLVTVALPTPNWTSSSWITWQCGYYAHPPQLIAAHPVIRHQHESCDVVLTMRIHHSAAKQRTSGTSYQ